VYSLIHWTLVHPLDIRWITETIQDIL